MILTFVSAIIFCHSVPSLVQRGDDLFRAMDYPGAIALYSEYLAAKDTSAEIYWRIARASICAGDISMPSEQERWYNNALDASMHAVRLDPQNSNAQCWYAVSLGYIAMFEGSRTKVEYCRRIQNALEKAVELDPRNDIAYSIYGTFFRALANVSWLERQLADLLLGGLPKGGYPEAEKMLLKAAGLAPNVLRHQYELGLVYYETGRIAKGDEVFRAALKLPRTLASDEQRITAMKQRLQSSR